MKFGYALLYVADVEETVAFYESGFGLKRTLVHESGYASAAVLAQRKSGDNGSSGRGG